MKRFLTLCIGALCSVVATAQISISSNGAYLQLTGSSVHGVDAVILFNGITAATELTCTQSGTVQWNKHDGSFYSNAATISPEDDTGYILLVDGRKVAFVWIFDYARYSITFNAFAPNDPQPDACQTLSLNVDLTTPDLTYTDTLGVRQVLPRTMTLHYDKYTFNNTNTWTLIPTDTTIRLPLTTLVLGAPKADTHFVLQGDDYAIQMGLTPDSIVCDYTAVAVEIHPQGTIQERDALNELNRSSDKEISGSAPLMVDFEARSNTPTAAYHEWLIYNTETPNRYIRYNDINFRYIFRETGSYVARLVANSVGECKAIDSLHITVRESFIDVPNVFTPNNDGINDEFRIAYRSIKRYSIVVVNRWGVVVYRSSDPTKGWDGRINGHPAAEGTYYYMIEAYGTDKNSKGKDIRYKLSGDINLMR